MVKNINDVTDLTGEEFDQLIERAIAFKGNPRSQPGALDGKIVRLLFDSPSLRTKTSFETAVRLLGGTSFYDDINKLTDERGTPREDPKDIIRNFDGFLTDCYVMRDYSGKILEAANSYSTKKVINGFSNTGHPSQALADMAAIRYSWGTNKGLTYVAISPDDGSGVMESFIYATLLLEQDMMIITPSGSFDGKNRDFYRQVDKLERRYGGKLSVTRDIAEVEKADNLYIDEFWDPKDPEFVNKPVPQGYQVNEAVLAGAKPGLRVLHCQPAHREREITSTVMDGKHSFLGLQSEFRLHSAMSLLCHTVGKSTAET